MTPHRAFRALAAAMCVAACATATVAVAATAAGAAEPVGVALLPLVNLSGVAEASQRFDDLLLAGMTGRGPVVEPGVVNAVMDSLRLRPTSTLTLEQMRALRRALGVRYLVLGSLLEQSMIRTPDAQFPCAGLMMKVVDADSARVVWADSKFACGDDKERIFGWGRDFDANHVAVRVCDAMTQGIRRAIWPALERGKK